MEQVCSQGAIPVSWSSSLETNASGQSKVRYPSSQFYSIRCVHKLQVLGTWRGQQGKLNDFPNASRLLSSWWHKTQLFLLWGDVWHRDVETVDRSWVPCFQAVISPRKALSRRGSPLHTWAWYVAPCSLLRWSRGQTLHKGVVDVVHTKPPFLSWVLMLWH